MEAETRRAALRAAAKVAFGASFGAAVLGCGKTEIAATGTGHPSRQPAEDAHGAHDSVAEHPASQHDGSSPSDATPADAMVALDGPEDAPDAVDVWMDAADARTDAEVLACVG